LLFHRYRKPSLAIQVLTVSADENRAVGYASYLIPSSSGVSVAERKIRLAVPVRSTTCRAVCVVDADGRTLDCVQHGTCAQIFFRSRRFMLHGNGRSTFERGDSFLLLNASVRFRSTKIIFRLMHVVVARPRFGYSFRTSH
jgi:hypothetical protein